MKSSLLVLSFFLLLFFFSNPSLGAPQPLYDISGDEVVTGTQYYILSAIWGAGGGGLNLFSGRNSPCPMDVYQEGSDLQYGRPLLFYPANYTGVKGTVVYESTDLNIKFNAHPSSCNQYSTVWKVDNYDDKEGAWFITTDGVIGNPGPQTLQNWFKLEKFNEVLKSYKIVHCPSVCESCVKLCSDISIQTQRRLVLSETPFLFGFVIIKVSEIQEYKGRFNGIIKQAI